MKVDIAKIFLTPPKRLFERVVLFFMLVITFSIFFRPLQFSSMLPAEAVVMAMLPTLSLSWGWIVLIRFMFNRSEYII